jgi:hypothetical protein
VRRAGRHGQWRGPGSVLHLWDHYLFTGDKKFLRETAYPLMKGAAQFMLHWLIEDPKSGWLVTNPSTSPENTIKINGKQHLLTMASTMDMSIIRELFTALIKTQRYCKQMQLSVNSWLRQRKLYPYHIGKMASCRNGSMIGMIRMINTGISRTCSGYSRAARSHFNNGPNWQRLLKNL